MLFFDLAQMEEYHMKKTFGFRKAIALVLAIVCVFATSTTAFAMDNAYDETQVARAVQTNRFTLDSNSDTATVQLEHDIVAGSTKKTYQVVKLGADCTVVVRFTNASGNYTLALTANNGQYTEGIGVTIPAGTYNVSFASTPCTVLNCWCVFKF